MARKTSTQMSQLRWSVSVVGMCLLVLFVGWAATVEGQSVRPRVKQVSAGYPHFLALMDDGSVRCFAGNYSAECRCNGTTGIKFVAAGELTSILITTNGSLQYYINDQQFLKAAIVQSIQDLSKNPNATLKEVSMSSWTGHGIALLENGTSYVLGNYTDFSHSIFQPSTLNDVRRVAAGDGFSTYLLNNGSARVYGDPGRFPNNYTYSAMDDALTVSSVVQISAGLYYVAALLSNGTVRILGHPAPDYSRTSFRWSRDYFYDDISPDIMDRIQAQTNVTQCAVGNGAIFLRYQSGAVCAFLATHYWCFGSQPIVDIAVGLDRAIFLYADGRIGTFVNKTLAPNEIEIPEELQLVSSTPMPSAELISMGMPTGAIAGLAVLGVLVGISFIIIAILLSRLRRQRSSEAEVKKPVPASTSSTSIGEMDKSAPTNLVYVPPGLYSPQPDPQAHSEGDLHSFYSPAKDAPAVSSPSQSAGLIAPPSSSTPSPPPIPPIVPAAIPIAKEVEPKKMNTIVGAFAVAKQAHKGGKRELTLQPGGS